MGQVAWRIECACDAEIVRRAERHGDKKAVIEATASSLGTAPSTMYKNAQVSELVEETAKIINVDNFDKFHYLAVLTAPKEEWQAAVTSESRSI